MDKKTARRQGLQARKNIPADVRSEKSRIIADILIRKITGMHCIGCYVTLNDEVQTEAILKHCLENGIRLGVPKVTGSTLKFYEITSLNDLQEGCFHVREPMNGREVMCEEMDLMIVPLSAFDDENHRTGYGKGYYDSVLKRCRRTAGIAFAEQKVDRIETDPWDVDLDEVIYA